MTTAICRISDIKLTTLYTPETVEEHTNKDGNLTLIEVSMIYCINYFE